MGIKINFYYVFNQIVKKLHIQLNNVKKNNTKFTKNFVML